MRDFAQVRADGVITKSVARDALALLDVDEFGLDDMDARILRTIIEMFDGGPVGLESVAAALGEDSNTIEEVYEPFLVSRTACCSARHAAGSRALQAYKKPALHLGYPPPRTEAARTFLTAHPGAGCR